MRNLSGPSPRGRIGVSFDKSASTFTALEKMHALAGDTSDAGEQGCQFLKREKSTAIFFVK